MAVTCITLLFEIGTLFQLDILAWIIGIPLLMLLVVFLVRQYRLFCQLQTDLEQLSKIKTHSVEYELVLKAMRLCVWRIDVAKRIVTFDSDYREHSDNLILPDGGRIDDVVSNMLPEYRDSFTKGLNDLFDGRVDEFHMQYQMSTSRSDTPYWSESFLAVEKRNLDGRPETVVGTTMRIDQQKEIETALTEALYHAEESDRLKSAFLANISHEVRTPLNAIVGFSDVLPLAESDEERQKLIGLIRKNNAQLLHLFDGIVSMAKLEARGRSAIHKTTFGIREVFVDLQAKYMERSIEKGVPIEIAQEDSLPQLCTDMDCIREVLNQYINNAMKYTSAGKITLGCSEIEDRVRIWVQDTGRGIPAEKCNERLFERFVKIDEFDQGSGLGLSICRSLALTIDGQVGMESEYGKGSTFWVELEKY